MNLMERWKARRSAKLNARFEQVTAGLEFGTVDTELVAGEDGVLQDRLADPEEYAAVCPECDLPVVGDSVMGEDGSVWHERCKLHRMFGHLGDSPAAKRCAVCGEAM